MAWWHRLFPQRTKQFTVGSEYAVPFRLYSKDGKRSVEVRVRRDGLAYFVEQEWVEGTTFKNRGRGQEIGPYETPELAETAAVASSWFSGREHSN
jgi:hypothetical protein